MSATEIDVQPAADGGPTRVSIRGAIDDQSEFRRAFDGVEGAVEIDLGAVESIVSTGIRTWILALRSLSERSTIRFVNVPLIMIEQFNLIANTRAEGTVESFFAPYYCEECDETKDLLLSLSEHAASLGDPSSLSPPELTCPDCDGSLEFDEIPERYFTFLEHQLATR